MTSRLLRLSRAATLMAIAVMAWQINLPLPLPQFDTPHLPLPYLAPAIHPAEIAALIALSTYALAGWPNRTALRSSWRSVFALSGLGLILFGALSITWSPHRGLAALQVLHLAIGIAFALLITCADWSPTSMASALLLGLLLHSMVGFIQIGLRPEVEISPQNSGISVVFNGAEHWQRVYGLSPHPNILGGHLAVGAILIVGLIIQPQRAKRFWLGLAWLIIWITLLLTFSRSAWLAVIGGSAIAVTLLLRGRHLTGSLSKPLMTLGGLGMMAIVIFGVWFQPFLANRLNVTATPYETQAITGRLNWAQWALQIFAAHPLTGV
ncbi:MAG TPA: O-antigen ligase family protein, partial [Anaerolineae bacterium]|nr:O-antigen ligase family protein [Anaerolineae bacterium]